MVGWKQRAKDFISKIWEEIDEPEIDIGDIVITEEVDSDVDPNLVKRSQSGSCLRGIQGQK